MDAETAEWCASLQAAIGAGEKICRGVEELDVAIVHIVQLIKDSSVMLETGSHGTAAFLAITAIEETAKVSVSLFRHAESPLRRSKDPLYRHEKKHQLAMAPVLSIGSRLGEAIGESRLKELLDLGRSGELVRSREASLYIERISDRLVVPRDAISFDYARELLLLAIEVFDDGLVGYTNESMRLGQDTDQLFDKWAG